MKKIAPHVRLNRKHAEDGAAVVYVLNIAEACQAFWVHDRVGDMDTQHSSSPSAIRMPSPHASTPTLDCQCGHCYFNDVLLAVRSGGDNRLVECHMGH